MASRAMRLRWWVSDRVRSIPLPVLLWLNICPCCLRHSITVGRRSTRTAYYDESMNWETSCIDCYEEHDDYWLERWQEYYAGCL
jgi:hypothetical protein